MNRTIHLSDMQEIKKRTFFNDKTINLSRLEELLETIPKNKIQDYKIQSNQKSTQKIFYDPKDPEIISKRLIRKRKKWIKRYIEYLKGEINCNFYEPYVPHSESNFYLNPIS